MFSRECAQVVWIYWGVHAGEANFSFRPRLSHMGDVHDILVVAVSLNTYPRNMASGTGASREELDQRAQAGETVVPGGTGGKSLEAQEHLAEGINHATRLLNIFYATD